MFAVVFDCSIDAMPVPRFGFLDELLTDWPLVGGGVRTCAASIIVSSSLDRDWFKERWTFSDGFVFDSTDEFEDKQCDDWDEGTELLL